MTVLINRNMYYVDMSSRRNVVLSAFLEQQGITSANVTINIIDGAVIGSSNTGLPALATGDLSGKNVTLNNYGEIQGAGGAPNSNGGPAIHINTGITLNNFGAIRSGGGGGIRGGTGASGTWITGWGAQKWRTGTNKYGWYKGSAGCTKFHAYWADSKVGLICQFPYIYKSTYMYTYGSAGPGVFSGFNYIKRSKLAAGTGGSGGVGGRGRGYGQSRHNGTGGNAGSNSAGRGGTGGAGGNWGARSSNASRGKSGTAFGNGESAGSGGIRYKRVTTTAPAFTYTRRNAGYSIDVAGHEILTYDKTQGVLNGPTKGAISAPVPAQKLDLNFLKVG